MIYIASSLGSVVNITTSYVMLCYVMQRLGNCLLFILPHLNSLENGYVFTYLFHYVPIYLHYISSTKYLEKILSSIEFSEGSHGNCLSKDIGFCKYLES